MRPGRLDWINLVAWLLVGGVSVAQTDAPTAKSDSLAPLIATLRAVDREGKGNVEATQAWADLTARATVDQLPVVLAGMDGASPLAINWLRSAVDAIAERQLQHAGHLPIAALEKFLGLRQHDQRARRLAYEWIARDDSRAPARWIPKMLDDPSLELRRDAVAAVLTAADASVTAQENDAALAGYRKALGSARDLDQVKAAAEALKKLNQGVDLAHHFGFVMDWKLVGPFDNVKGKGFDVAYPPEEKLDLQASYPVESGPITWIAHHTDDEYGSVDLNKALDKHKGAVAYAVAEFQSDRGGPAELRLGTQAANKIWLNGKLLSFAEVYHANDAMDQYVGRGQLQAGRNLILLKICQNEQTEEWAQDWKFQLRVCDETGKAILATDRPAPRPAKNQTATNAPRK